MQGPTDSANPSNITTIATTNATGQAQSIFRLPADNRNTDSSIGKWSATATIQADNSTLRQSLSFTTQWTLQITSVSTQNSLGQNQTIFYPGKTATVMLTISNQGQPQEANVTLNIQDSTGKTINQTQIQNTQINSGSNLTQVETTLQIPNSANTGEATINAALYSGTFQNIDVPASENQNAYFTIATNTTPHTSPKPTPTLTESSVSLFSWLLVATGLFTFTALFMFLRRKPTPTMGTQMPNLPPTITSPVVASPPLFPPNTQETTQELPTEPTSTPQTAPEKTINATILSEVPSIYETFDIPTSESASPQGEKQKMVDHLTKISSINQRVQTLESQLKTEKDQLNKEITELNKTLEEQERAVKSYFDSIRQAIAAISTKPSEINKQYDAQSTEVNNEQNTPQIEINNQQNSQPKQQSIEDKNAKETQSKIQRNQRTQQEDIKIAEHTKED